MHRDFTLQVIFFRVLLESSMVLKLDRAWMKAGLFNVCCGVLSAGESLGSKDDLFHYSEGEAGR